MSKYKKELLEAVTAECKSWRQVCLRLGIKPATGSQTYIQKKVSEYGIPTTHFTGQGWNKGGVSIRRKNAIEHCKKDYEIGSHKLKNWLIRDGYKKEQCEICGLSEWNNEPIVLELDHIDSNHYNNELINLQIVCPNCHAQLTRNRKKAK